MVDKISKSLRKLNGKERKALEKILKMIKAGKLKTLDVKQLKGHSSIYRVRKGKLHVLYQIHKGDKIKILAIERRSEKTYKKF